MNRREPEYPVELESQFIMRLPDEPAKALRDVLKTGENFKNRLTIQIENDMRRGEVRFDHWLLHAKIVDLPTIVESLKTVDRKSVYKTADISQLMICKHEIEPATTEEESPTKNKKKDPFKVDKKFLWPHGIAPPTKNVRKKRFRKTLKKKSVEAPEIEKEVKRLLRADNEAVSVTWEVITEEDEHLKKNEPKTSTSKGDKTKTKKDHNVKTETANQSSKVEDIFGEAVSDSDLEDESVNVDVDDNRMFTSYEDPMSDSNSVQDSVDNIKGRGFTTQFKPEMFLSPQQSKATYKAEPSPSYTSKQSRAMASTADYYNIPLQDSSGNVNYKLQQLTLQLEELKQRKSRTQLEIASMENMTLRQRFQEVLQTLNQDIMSKEIECQKLQKLGK